MTLLGSEGKFVQATYGIEAVACQKAATMYGARVKNFTCKPERPLTHTGNMNSRGFPQKAKNLEVHIPIAFDLEPDVDTILRMEAHHRMYAGLTPSTLVSGAYAYTLRDFIKGTDTLASPLDTMSFEVDRDDGTAQLCLGAVLTTSKMKIADKQLIDLSYSGMAQHYTEHGDKSNTLDSSTYTGRVLQRGGRFSEASTIATAVNIKISTGGALNGTAKFKATRGAVSYGSTETTIVPDTWQRVYDAAGVDMSGDPLDPFEIMFTTGTGTLTANDIYSFAMTRTKASSPTFSTRNPLSMVAMAVTLNGVSYVIEGAEIDSTVMRVERRGGGSKYAQGMLNGGVREDWKIKLTRKYTDRVAWDLLKSGSVGILDIDIYGDLIGATAYQDRWRRYFPQVQVSGAGSDPAGPGPMNETIVIEPSWDLTNALCTETINSTIATLP